MRVAVVLRVEDSDFACLILVGFGMLVFGCIVAPFVQRCVLCKFVWEVYSLERSSVGLGVAWVVVSVFIVVWFDGSSVAVGGIVGVYVQV